MTAALDTSRAWLAADGLLRDALRRRDRSLMDVPPGWTIATASRPDTRRADVARAEQDRLDRWLADADRRQRLAGADAFERAAVRAQHMWGAHVVYPPYCDAQFSTELYLPADELAAAYERTCKVAPWWRMYGPARREVQALVAAGEPVRIQPENPWGRPQGHLNDSRTRVVGSYVCAPHDRLDARLELTQTGTELSEYLPISVFIGDVTGHGDPPQYRETHEALGVQAEPISEFGDELNSFGFYLPQVMTSKLRWEFRVANPQVCALTGRMTAGEGCAPIDEIREAITAGMAALPD